MKPKEQEEKVTSTCDSFLLVVTVHRLISLFNLIGV